MRIVAFADRSLYAQSVIDHTAWLAGTSGASVDLVQIVWPNKVMSAQMSPIHPAGAVVFQDDRTWGTLAELRDNAAAQLEAARLHLLERGVSDVRVHVLEGSVSELLADAAMGASMIVMGKRGEHADVARLPLGANLERLVRHSSAPVLAVSRQFRPINRMLIAMDTDRGSVGAVEAVAAGILPSIPTRLLHVGLPSEMTAAVLGRAAARLNAAGYPTTSEIVEGIARVVVPERVVAGEFGLVAMGAFSGSRLKALIFGNLTIELSRACQVPILLSA